MRDWLCDALTSMGQRDPRHVALVERIRSDLTMPGALPADADQATVVVEDAICEQIALLKAELPSGVGLAPSRMKY